MTDNIRIALIQPQAIRLRLEKTGPPGIQGGPGIGSDKHFEMPFVDGLVILVQHNLNKYPTVAIIDSAGDEVIGDVEHVNNNVLTVSFSSPFSGRVICN